MTRPTTVDHAREQLDAMLRLLPLDVEGEPTKRESPDFMIKRRTRHDESPATADVDHTPHT